MKSPVLSLLGLLMLVAPASAGSARHHHHFGHRHIVGTHARHGESGFPITAAKDSIRINSVGEVISQPVPIIRKERNFNDRARQDLSKPQPQPQSTPTPQP